MLTHPLGKGSGRISVFSDSVIARDAEMKQPVLALSCPCFLFCDSDNKIAEAITDPSAP